MAKLITVFGVTGAQGKSLAEALLGDGSYKVRAPTRNPDSSEAKSLGEKGCEVVKVDMDDADSLEKAITGSYGVFVDANYWGLLVNRFDTTMDREVRNKQGKTIGDICKKTGVKHLVYCGMEHVEPGLGKPRSNTDGIVEKYLDEIQVPNTSTRVPMYYETFTTSRPPKNEDGAYNMVWPVDGSIHAIGISDVGPVVLTVFNNPDKYIGKKLGLSGDRLTMDEYAAAISEATGKPHVSNYISVERFPIDFPFPGANDMAAMFEYYNVVNPVRDISLTRTLNPNTATFRQWAVKNKDKFIRN